VTGGVQKLKEGKMTLKEVKKAANDGDLYLDVRVKNRSWEFKQAKVFYKNSTYAEIEGIKVKWELVHKHVNSHFVLKLN
jgi:hypothetical protein